MTGEPGLRPEGSGKHADKHHHPSDKPGGGGLRGTSCKQDIGEDGVHSAQTAGHRSDPSAAWKLVYR